MPEIAVCPPDYPIALLLSLPAYKTNLSFAITIKRIAKRSMVTYSMTI